MGTFGGHVLPGSFFVMFGVWWTVRIFQRYYRSVYAGSQRYSSSATFPCSCHKLRSCEIEGPLKILLCGAGLAGEMATGMRHGKFIYLGNAQHSTMFVCFMLSGVLDILTHHRLIILDGANYVSLILALIVEGVLFKYHVHGADDLEKLVHNLLIYVIMTSVLLAALEMCYRNQVLAAVGRAYATLLQGTWFWQVGFILYNPTPGAEPWDPDNHDHLMIATMTFTWHVGVDFILVLAIGGAIGAYYRRQGNAHEDDVVMEPLIADEDAEYGVISRHGNNNVTDETIDAPLGGFSCASAAYA